MLKFMNANLIADVQSPNPSVTSNRAFVMNDGPITKDPELVKFVLDSIFEKTSSEGLVNEVRNALISDTRPYNNHTEVALRAQQYLLERMSKTQILDTETLRVLHIIAKHLDETYISTVAYDIKGKYNPNAVFWPDPTHPKYPRNLFDEIPYGERYGFIDETTPIGSAGSCFAMEIAHRLQGGGYNYVITEPHTVHNSSGKGYSDASAAWGIMFNVPSLAQLVEKAFGVKNLPRLIWYHDQLGKYWDPFREDITFASPEEYEAKYDSHIRACREALTRSKVFIMTFGLNEVWELKSDGSVFSRAPWSLSPSLVRRKIMTVQENIDGLQRMLNVWRHYNPELKLIVTVSPVPFHATFRGDHHHAVVANCHSKSTLRVAAEEFVSRNKDVYYFPSYETVMYCTRNAWQEDQRHVSRAAVNNVMRLFGKMFLKSEDPGKLILEEK